EEVKKPFAGTWILYAKKATEGKGSVVNHVIFKEEEENISAFKIKNLMQYPKSIVMEVWEQIEKKISDQIDEALVTVPAKREPFLWIPPFWILMG
ncbi:hypothetical protein HMI54_005263, partial [Coelomomyces lativittatus]